MRRLDDGEELYAAAYMWNRHRLFLHYSAGAFLALLLGSEFIGFEAWGPRVAIGVAGAAVAGMATTNYRVLARTSQGYVLFRASKIRQYAVAVLQRWPEQIELSRVGNSLVVSDWQIENLRYSVPRSFEQSMLAMSPDPN